MLRKICTFQKRSFVYLFSSDIKDNSQPQDDDPKLKYNKDKPNRLFEDTISTNKGSYKKSDSFNNPNHQSRVFEFQTKKPEKAILSAFNTQSHSVLDVSKTIETIIMTNEEQANNKSSNLKVSESESNKSQALPEKIHNAPGSLVNSYLPKKGPAINADGFEKNIVEANVMSKLALLRKKDIIEKLPDSMKKNESLLEVAYQLNDKELFHKYFNLHSLAAIASSENLLNISLIFFASSSNSQVVSKLFKHALKNNTSSLVYDSTIIHMLQSFANDPNTMSEILKMIAHVNVDLSIINIEEFKFSFESLIQNLNKSHQDNLKSILKTILVYSKFLNRVYSEKNASNSKYINDVCQILPLQDLASKLLQTCQNYHNDNRNEIIDILLNIIHDMLVAQNGSRHKIFDYRETIKFFGQTFEEIATTQSNELNQKLVNTFFELNNHIYYQNEFVILTEEVMNHQVNYWKPLFTANNIMEAYNYFQLNKKLNQFCSYSFLLLASSYDELNDIVISIWIDISKNTNAHISGYFVQAMANLFGNKKFISKYSQPNSLAVVRMKKLIEIIPPYDPISAFSIVKGYIIDNEFGEAVSHFRNAIEKPVLVSAQKLRLYEFFVYTYLNSNAHFDEEEFLEGLESYGLKLVESFTPAELISIYDQCLYDNKSIETAENAKIETILREGVYLNRNERIVKLIQKSKEYTKKITKKAIENKNKKEDKKKQEANGEADNKDEKINSNEADIKEENSIKEVEKKGKSEKMNTDSNSEDLVESDKQPEIKLDSLFPKESLDEFFFNMATKNNDMINLMTYNDITKDLLVNRYFKYKDSRQFIANSISVKYENIDLVWDLYFWGIKNHHPLAVALVERFCDVSGYQIPVHLDKFNKIHSKMNKDTILEKQKIAVAHVGPTPNLKVTNFDSLHKNEELDNIFYEELKNNPINGFRALRKRPIFRAIKEYQDFLQI